MKFKVGDKVQIYNDNSDVDGYIGTVTDVRDINGFIRKVTGVRDINRQINGYDNLSFYYVDVYHNGRVRGMNFIDDELRAAPPPPTVEYNKQQTIKMSTSMRVSIWTFVALQVVFLYIALNT